MPNYVTNQITFGNGKKQLAEFRRMAEEMRMDGEEVGSFDFNKLIPMPQELNITAGTQTDDGLKLYRQFLCEGSELLKRSASLGEVERNKMLAEHKKKWDKVRAEDEEVWALGVKAFENVRRYGCPTWYEWCYKNWGTKWNACHCVPLDENAATMQFDTAWGDVRGLIKLLSQKYPNQKIRYRWADEDVGVNVGEMVFRDGQAIETNIPQEQSRDAYELAAEILCVDLAEYDLYLTEDKSTYQYMPDGPKQPKTLSKGKADRQER